MANEKENQGAAAPRTAADTETDAKAWRMYHETCIGPADAVALRSKLAIVEQVAESRGRMLSESEAYCERTLRSLAGLADALEALLRAVAISTPARDTIAFNVLHAARTALVGAGRIAAPAAPKEPQP